MNIRVKAGMSDLERELEYGFRDYETTKTFDLPWMDDTKAAKVTQFSVDEVAKTATISVPAYTVVNPKTQARTEVKAEFHQFYEVRKGEDGTWIRGKKTVRGFPDVLVTHSIIVDGTKSRVESDPHSLGQRPRRHTCWRRTRGR